jgi:hypothetical protein
LVVFEELLLDFSMEPEMLPTEVDTLSEIDEPAELAAWAGRAMAPRSRAAGRRAAWSLDMVDSLKRRGGREGEGREKARKGATRS